MFVWFDIHLYQLRHNSHSKETYLTIFVTVEICFNVTNYSYVDGCQQAEECREKCILKKPDLTFYA